MFRTGTIRNLLVYLLVVAVVPGCQSMRAPLYDSENDAPETIISRVQVGDYIEVHTRDGEVRSFTVTAIEETALVGQDIRMNFAEIAIIQPPGTDSAAGKTGRIAVAVVAVILGVAILAALPNPYEGMLAGGLF
jgi:hypothetical protein